MPEKDLIPYFDERLPWLSTKQMIEVDRAMMEDYHIELIQMMENAGRNLAFLANVQFLDHTPKRKRVTVLAGTGGNGGGALVCARHLSNFGAQVEVFITNPKERFTPIPAHQLDILQRMGLPIFEGIPVSTAQTPDLTIDGIIGYSLKGAPRGMAKSLIKWANEQPCPILSLDAPSGVDSTSGKAFDPAIRATATMTLALPKQGLRVPEVASYVGELYLADISVPLELYAKPPLNLQVSSIFSEASIVQLFKSQN